MNESLSVILDAIKEIQSKGIEITAQLEKEKNIEVRDNLNILLISIKKTLKDLVNEAIKVGHYCSVCEVILIDNEKTKVNCASCVEDFEKCKDETIMNFGQFAKRQRERIEIFKEHRPQEIALMQIKEHNS